MRAAIAILLVATPATALAQTFPPDTSYVPLRCGDGAMTDRYMDEAGAQDERDIVGDEAAPAGLRAVDAEYLYLRLRLDDDPAPGGSLRPFSWGMEIDLDGDTTTYEILMLVDGIGTGTVTLAENSTTTLPNDPNDPADEPPVASYDFTTHGRSAAAGSTYGDDADHFLDFAVPWADLAALGLDRDTSIYVWAASSSTQTSLNGDFACHDGAGGDPTLDGIATDPTVLDPTVDTDGDGFPDAQEIAEGTDPFDPNDFPASRLEGGGGCAVGGGAASPLAVLMLGLLVRRRRRRIA